MKIRTSYFYQIRNFTRRRIIKESEVNNEDTN